MKEIDAAIDALEAALSNDLPYIDRCKSALAGLRSLKREPFAWYCTEHGEVRDIEYSSMKPTYEGLWKPLYTHPAPEAKQGEPVATLTVRDDMGADIKFHRALTLLPGQTFALYTTHPAPEAKKEPTPMLTEKQRRYILDLALDLEKTGRIVSLSEGQERSDMVARNRNIQCALEDYLRNLTAPEAKQEPELIADLSMMVRRLVLSIRRLAEDDTKDLTFANACADWLKHKGLAGSPLRDNPAPCAKQGEREPFAWSYESAKAFALQEANKLLDAALLKTYPQGCDNGEVFDLWNKARAAIAQAEKDQLK